MFEIWGMVLFLSMLADAAAQVPLPLKRRAQSFPKLSKRLKADEYYTRDGTRMQRPIWTAALAERRAQDAKRHGAMPFMYFVSGSSRPPHIRGMWRIGLNVGVVASEVARASVEELKRMGPSHIDVFVDSGAFEEFTHPMKIAKLERRQADLLELQNTVGLSPKDAKTLAGIPKRLAKFQLMDTEPDWEGTGRAKRPMRPVIPLYEELAGPLGAWLHVVAPDKIADQPETLRRMAKYGPRLVEIARKDAEVFVPLQWGENSLAEFEEMALTTMGVPDELLYKFVPSMPLKAAALPWQDVLDYVAKWKPRRLHLLGVGPKRRSELGRPTGMEMMAQIKHLSPYTDISLDSALIPATTGKKTGPGGGPRILERARMVLKEEGWTPTELQELAMVMAWPDLYLAAQGRIGPRSKWVMPSRLPQNLPISRYREEWRKQNIDAGMEDAAREFERRYATEVAEWERRSGEPWEGPSVVLEAELIEDEFGSDLGWLWD